jgi:ferredoxin--NADP+ reductase
VPVPYGERQYVSSQQFVGWYNGDPEQAGRDFGLQRVTDVVVIGAGNVALDVARLLLKSPALLEETNVARPALEQLRASSVERVTIVARRGPEHAAFSTKELRELTLLPELDLELDVEKARAAAAAATERPARRLLQLLADAGARPRRGGAGAKILRFAFGCSPHSLVLDSEGRVAAVRVEDGSEVPAQLVVSCVGYRGHTLDAQLAPLAPGGARLQNTGGKLRTGLYATGWAKRGASGIVGTNKFCAAETVQTFLRDELRPEKPGQLPVLPPHVLSREQMEALENAERARGKGRFTTFAEIEACLEQRQ